MKLKGFAQGAGEIVVLKKKKKKKKEIDSSFECFEVLGVLKLPRASYHFSDLLQDLIISERRKEEGSSAP